MAGIVYLKTDKFAVKLEAIAFKVRDFEPLCTTDFLFPKGKVWLHPPVVGVDVMRHPRDPSTALLLFCFGIGCVILRFHLGEQLPPPILKFLQDERIFFVGFGIPEKKDLFPFDKFGLKESKVDVGYMAAKLLNDPKLRKRELADLARRVLGIKKMVGLTEAKSLGRHEEIKCAICEVFVSSVIAKALQKRIGNSAKKNLFVKNLDPPSLSTEGCSKIPASNKENNEAETKQGNDGDVGVQAKGKEDNAAAAAAAGVSPPGKCLKGILKSPSPRPQPQICHPPPPKPKERRVPNLKRANSKGHNVCFRDKNNTLNV